MRAKELADLLRAGGAGSLTNNHENEIAALLDELDAIKSAMPEEVRVIRERHDRKGPHPDMGYWSDCDSEAAHADRAALLAIAEQALIELESIRAQALPENIEAIRKRVCGEDPRVTKYTDLLDARALLDAIRVLVRANQTFIGVEFRRRTAENERDAALAEVQRLTACDSHRRNQPIMVVGCSECIACLRIDLKWTKQRADVDVQRLTDQIAQLSAALAGREAEAVRLTADLAHSKQVADTRQENLERMTNHGGDLKIKLQERDEQIKSLTADLEAERRRADGLAELICNADPIGWAMNGRIESADAWQKRAEKLIKGASK